MGTGRSLSYPEPSSASPQLKIIMTVGPHRAPVQRASGPLFHIFNNKMSNLLLLRIYANLTYENGFALKMESHSRVSEKSSRSAEESQAGNN